MFIKMLCYKSENRNAWASIIDLGTLILVEERRLRRACAYAHTHQSLSRSDTLSMNEDEDSAKT